MEEMKMVGKEGARRAVIIANGALPDLAEARRRIEPVEWLICADGGARHALEMGLRPHIIVGDLDSLEPEQRTELEAAGVRIEPYPADKDQTDLELALQLAVEAGAYTVDVLAVQGGRLDQSLANLLLLTRPEWAAVQVRALVGQETAWAVRSEEEVTIKGTAGDRLSLVPLSSTVTGVTLTGVKWPLEEATLHLGSTWSISNVMAEPDAYLRLREGLLLVVHALRS